VIRALALIMARGGSKGVPGKNMRLVGGKPLIVHTFEAAGTSRLLDRTVLSTDDPRIAETGREFGIDVPFLRPAELAKDNSHVIDATIHALNWLAENEGYMAEYSMLLQPTSPFRTADDIDNAIRLAVEKKADAVVSVTPSIHHPCHAKRIDPKGILEEYVDTSFSRKRRQDIPLSFSLNGAIYLVKSECLLKQKSWCPPGTYAYVMPQERSLDIDTEWDVRVADFLLMQKIQRTESSEDYKTEVRYG
jgi:CMP-N,N'-diacetyllegionaminic acid synthase